MTAVAAFIHVGGSGRPYHTLHSCQGRRR